jgi:L-histidine N-alpha-methyltransferase
MMRETTFAARRDGAPEWVDEVRGGLSAQPRWLPTRLLYDDRGSTLFEAITRLPEYYLTRTELGIFRMHARAIAERFGRAASVIELGAGTGAKTRVILEALTRRHGPLAYYPIDVSARALAAARSLAGPAIAVHPLLGRYEPQLAGAAALRGPKLALFIGSSIGNYDPSEAVALLARVRAALAPGDGLLVGADLRKSPRLLVPAYDDAAGVTAAFNKNLLRRLNRELGADFDLDAFGHVALWNDGASRIEMHLESLRAQRVRVEGLGLSLHLARGERIHTENSYKLSLPAQKHLLRSAGFEPETCWLDRKGWFAVHLARGSAGAIVR